MQKGFGNRKRRCSVVGRQAKLSSIAATPSLGSLIPHPAGKMRAALGIVGMFVKEILRCEKG